MNLDRIATLLCALILAAMAWNGAHAEVHLWCNTRNEAIISAQYPELVTQINEHGNECAPLDTVFRRGATTDHVRLDNGNLADIAPALIMAVDGEPIAPDVQWTFFRSPLIEVQWAHSRILKIPSLGM